VAAIPVLMPRLGMTMEEGTVVAWQVETGKRVEKGELLFVLETEKSETEIEATAAGFLRHVYVAAGDTAPCGALLAALTGTADEAFDAAAFERMHAAPAVAARGAEAPAGAAPPRKVRRGGPVAPAARKLARELGIDPAEVPGSGPGGRVTRRDVEAFAVARRDRIEVGAGVRLEVPRQGSGDPLLLLPGFGTDVSSFALEIPALAADFEVFGVNPRGVGRSDAAPADWSVAQAAADAAAVAPGPAHVVGASLGSAIAIELALAHPDRVRSLALLTPFVVATPRLAAVLRAWIEGAAAGPQVLARQLLPWLFSDELLRDDERRELTCRGLARSVAKVPPTSLAHAAAGLLAWSGTRVSDVSRIGVPTLVLVGGADLLTPGGEALAARIPGARCVRIEGAGHALAGEAPEAVCAALREHLHAARA
jgi:pyruvate dehydrogenase E2 component (dihydrolipoamide acetyltransferase)